MIHLAAGDLFVIGFFFLAVIVAGFSVRIRGRSDDVGFLLAGRPLTLPLFVMTLVSTWYGGILGVGEFSWRYGISNWLVQGFPYYLFAALFAWFLAPRIRATNLLTIPDKLEASYDRRTSLLGAGLTLVLVTPAPYMLMLGVLLQMLFGWGLLAGVLVATAVSVSYLFSGGFSADVRTDVVEFFFMFAGFAVILPYCATEYGGLGYLQGHLPPLHLSWHGGNSIQYLMVWFFIALWTFVDPAFHQRCYAARDERTARRGILVSILFWFIFDFLTASAGLYARAIIPGLEQPLMAYPMLAEAVLPPVAKGLFFAGILATIMSTLNTLAFVSGQTIGRDIYVRLTTGGRGSGDPGRSTPATRIGLAISLAVSIPVAVLMPSVIEIWYTVGTVTIPGLIIPVLSAYSRRLRLTPRYAFLSMLLGWTISTGWWVAGLLLAGPGGRLFGIEPIYPGLAASLLAAAPGFRARGSAVAGAD
ncbi:MAG TPA: sodium:solute symporter family protein [Bacteroidota bacterium]|nr:sodium:solute symporter family protein [Bacteroidota bacterium]